MLKSIGIHRIVITLVVTAVVVTGTMQAQTWQSLLGPPKARHIVDITISNDGQTLYACDKSVLFKSTDRGASWSSTGSSQAHEVSSPLVVTCKPIDPNIVVVAKLDTFFYSTDGASSRQARLTGSGGSFYPLRLATSSVDNAVIYLGRKAGSASPIWRSNNSGFDWSSLPFEYASDLYGVFPDPSIAQSVWVGGSDPAGTADGSDPDKSSTSSGSKRGVWKYNPNNGTWDDKKMGDFNVRAVAVNGAKVYAGTAGTGAAPVGKFFRSTNGGNNWTQGGSLTGATVVCAIRVRNDNSILVATDNGVFLSTDDGVSFTGASTGMIDKNVLSFVVHPTSQATMYAGVPSALYWSESSGSSWSFRDNGLGRMPATSDPSHKAR